jgi:hypothetical protein
MRIFAHQATNQVHRFQVQIKPLTTARIHEQLGDLQEPKLMFDDTRWGGGKGPRALEICVTPPPLLIHHLVTSPSCRMQVNV